jgi:hypothetical protein
MRVERRGFSRDAILFWRISPPPPRRAGVAAAAGFSICDVFVLIGMLRASAN